MYIRRETHLCTERHISIHGYVHASIQNMHAYMHTYISPHPHTHPPTHTQTDTLPHIPFSHSLNSYLSIHDSISHLCSHDRWTRHENGCVRASGAKYGQRPENICMSCSHCIAFLSLTRQARSSLVEYRSLHRYLVLRIHCVNMKASEPCSSLFTLTSPCPPPCL